MKLLLIRHGETIDNVAGNLAGVTDSVLTAHGVLQTQRLGKHLAEKSFANIFCSDLQRAKRTAQAILDACSSSTSAASSEAASTPGTDSLVVLEILREQDFGSLEGTSWASKRSDSKPDTITASDHVTSETKASMDKRCNTFIDDYLMPLLIVEPECDVAVVSHGLLLSRLWKCLLARCQPYEVHLASEVVVGPHGLAHLGAWSNTGYLDLTISEARSNTRKPERDADELTTDKPALVELDSKEHTPGVFPTNNIDRAKATNQDESDLAMAAADPLMELGEPEDEEEPEGTSKYPETDITDGTSTETESRLHLAITVQAVNSCGHLRGLKRTRGGIGSAAHDSSQKTLDSFFKRQRTK